MISIIGSWNEKRLNWGVVSTYNSLLKPKSKFNLIKWAKAQKNNFTHRLLTGWVGRSEPQSEKFAEAQENAPPGRVDRAVSWYSRTGHPVSLSSSYRAAPSNHYLPNHIPETYASELCSVLSSVCTTYPCLHPNNAVSSLTIHSLRPLGCLCLSLVFIRPS